MVVLDAILYSIQKENTIFIIDCCGLDIVSWGIDKNAAIKDLEFTVRKSFDPKKGLSNRTPSLMIRQFFNEVKSNPDKHKPIIKEIPGYATIHIYDMVKRTIGDTEKNYKMDL